MSAENSTFKIDITARRVCCRDELVALGLVMDYYCNLYSVEDWANPATRIPLTEQDLRVRRLLRAYKSTAGGIHIDDVTAGETAAVIEEICGERDENAAAVFTAEAQLQKMTTKAQAYETELEEAKAIISESDKKLEMTITELEKRKVAERDERIKALEEAINNLKISNCQATDERNEDKENLRRQPEIIEQQKRTIERLRCQGGGPEDLWQNAEHNSENPESTTAHASSRNRRRQNQPEVGPQVLDETL